MKAVLSEQNTVSRDEKRAKSFMDENVQHKKSKKILYLKYLQDEEKNFNKKSIYIKL